MRILIAHNHYGEFATGGEAMVFNAESSLLEENNIEIQKYEKSNSSIDNLGLLNKVRSVINIHWSEDTIDEVGRVMDEFKPDILHVHNYKFVITPSIFKAAKDRGIKTVLTLHNYRLMVPCGNFMTKEGNVCERCMTQNPANILLRRCAQGSILKSYLQYRLFTKTKNKLNQLTDLVDKYIVLSEFAKEKLIQTGVERKMIFIKPNFINPLKKTEVSKKVERAVFIGRLSIEKGVANLLRNWENINYPLYIFGTGPMENELKKNARNNSNIHLMGNWNNEEIKVFLRDSAFMVFPSIWYETFGLTIVEAMSVSVPVIASNLGPRSEIVIDKKTGLLYDINNDLAFTEKVKLLIENKELRKQLGENAQEEYFKKYTPEENFELLKKIYSDLLK